MNDTCCWYFEILNDHSGHEAALPLFRSLLLENQNGFSKDDEDLTAASYIAANKESPSLQDLACRFSEEDVVSIARLKNILVDSGFTRRGVLKYFGIDFASKYSFSCGPIYVKPAAAGAKCPDKLKFCSSPLECFIKMFLLGFAISRKELETNLGEDTICLFEKFGMAFSSSISDEVVVPYIQLFPMEINCNDLIIATDWHPSVLMSTVAGTREEGAVMYIGPDSIALFQHMPLNFLSTKVEKFIDLCCGSGVQAIAHLSSIENANGVTSFCIDINARALNFTKFNAALNGFIKNIILLQTDLLKNADQLSSILEEASFDAILANPPFLPVPGINSSQSAAESIARRYGFFSDGGTDGENVLEIIIEFASRSLSPNGYLAIVSEFMNPGESLCNKIKVWWDEQAKHAATGVIFTNEFPVSRDVYSLRRSANNDEAVVWKEHLDNMKVLIFLFSMQFPSFFSTFIFNLNIKLFCRFHLFRLDCFSSNLRELHTTFP